MFQQWSRTVLILRSFPTMAARTPTLFSSCPRKTNSLNSKYKRIKPRSRVWKRRKSRSKNNWKNEKNRRTKFYRYSQLSPPSLGACLARTLPAWAGWAISSKTSSIKSTNLENSWQKETRKSTSSNKWTKNSKLPTHRFWLRLIRWKKCQLRLIAIFGIIRKNCRFSGNKICTWWKSSKLYSESWKS